MAVTIADAFLRTLDRHFPPAGDHRADPGGHRTRGLPGPLDAARVHPVVGAVHDMPDRRRLLRSGTVSAGRKSLHQLLAASSWMQVLPAPLRERVAADAYETTHTPREIVARKDEAAHSWMGVGEGLVKLMKVVRSGRVVRFSHIGEGGWIDEEWLALDTPRPYDIVAVTPARLIHVPAETYRLILHSSLEFNQFVIRQLSLAVARYRTLIEADRLSDPVARLAHVLVQLHDPTPGAHKPTRLHLSQEDLGELAGMTRQRTNTAIKALEKHGVLSVRYGGLLLKDFATLRRLAEQSN